MRDIIVSYNKYILFSERKQTIRMKRFRRLILQMLPGILGGLLVIWLCISGRGLEAETIVEYAPARPSLAALALLGMYAVKSISVFLPMLPLQLAAGIMFPRSAAVAVNAAGYAIGAAISYRRGLSAGAEAIDELLEKYPRLSGLIRGNRGSNVFLTFILRVVGTLPMDVTSMYLGSTRVAFTPYMLATMAGALPKIIAITLIGDSITRPGSRDFLISTALTAVLSLLSLLVFLIYRRHRDS